MESVFDFVVGIFPFYPEIKFIILLFITCSPNSSHSIFETLLLPIIQTYGIDTKFMQIINYLNLVI